MARIKWNQNPQANTNMNEVQKVPPNCLKNFMPNQGYMRQPFNSSMADQLAVLNNKPPTKDLNVSSVQPGQSSREGNFNYSCPPGMAGDPTMAPIDNIKGRSGMSWPQDKSTSGRADRAPTVSGIQSNLSDIPSIFGRKYTSQS